MKLQLTILAMMLCLNGWGQKKKTMKKTHKTGYNIGVRSAAISPNKIKFQPIGTQGYGYFYSDNDSIPRCYPCDSVRVKPIKTLFISKYMEQ